MVRLLQWILVLCLVVVPLQGFAQSASQSIGARKVRVNVNPEYPEVARKLAIRGVVQLWVKVTGDGAVKQVESTGGNPVLVDAAMNAVKKWRYEATGKETVEPVKITFN